MTIAIEDVTTVTPDSEEVRAKSKVIFLRKTSVVNQVTDNIKSNDRKIVNSTVTSTYTNKTTTDIVSQSQRVSDSTTTVQTNHTIKPHFATEGATYKSLHKLLSFKKRINRYPPNKTIGLDTIPVPRFHIKMNNEIEETDHNMHNSVPKAVRFKRNIKTLSVPQLQYAPVDIAFRAHISDSDVVPPKPKFSRAHGPVATRTTLRHLHIHKNDTSQKNAKHFEWQNFNKKLRMSKKFTNRPKKNRNFTVENKTIIWKSQNFFRKLYLDVTDLPSPTEVTKTKSKEHDGEKTRPRVKRDLPEGTTEYSSLATIEEPRDIAKLYITPNGIIEQTVPNTVLENLNYILTNNLSKVVHEVFHELNMTPVTPPDNKLLGSDLLFKVPSKYL